MPDPHLRTPSLYQIGAQEHAVIGAFQDGGSPKERVLPGHQKRPEVVPVSRLRPTAHDGSKNFPGVVEECRDMLSVGMSEKVSVGVIRNGKWKSRGLLRSE